MIRYFLSGFLLFFILSGYAQEQQYIRLNNEEIEALFLKNNLQLIIERYNVGIADAAIVQARLWDNPSLSVGNANLWSSQSQRNEIQEMATSSFIKNTEFSIELSQLIQTANKRGKLVRREKLSKEMALQEFEEVLRGLKVELRKTIYSLQYLQTYFDVLTNQRQSVSRLAEAYKKQVALGNIAKSELLRLQSSLMELDEEINEVRVDMTEQEKTLKVLLNVAPTMQIKVTVLPYARKKPSEIVLSDLLQLADESRPDMKRYKLQVQYHRTALDYEKSLRVPDITISAGYDRYGGVWKDFVGFGVSIDLPFLNRNQGNIKAAKLNADQSQYVVQQQQNIAHHEVAAAYSCYVYAYSFYERIVGDSLFAELDDMMEVYAKNLLNRNVSMLEYIDFTDAYKTNKRTMLDAEKKMKIQFEELQYIIGTEFY